MAKIVLIDDDDELRLALSVRLRAAGFEVMASDHPDTAIKLVLRHKPDLLILDIEMPSYTGLEFHECLKASERGRTIPVLYLTGRDSISHRARATKQGALGFITKPYSIVELITTIRQICSTDSCEPVVSDPSVRASDRNGDAASGQKQGRR